MSSDSFGIFWTGSPGARIINGVLAKGAVAVIRAYQLVVSPIIGPACRFTPTCSAYAIEAVARYGLLKGAFLAIRRILRCHPFHSGGIDPVP